MLSTVNNFGGWLTSLSTTIDYNVYGNATGAGSLRWPATARRPTPLPLPGGLWRGTRVLYVRVVEPLLRGAAGWIALWALCFDIRGALRPFRMRLDAVTFQRETAAITARAIGRVRLGSPRGAVEQVYGRRVTHRSGRQLLGFLKLRGTRTAAYRRHGGLFDVSYAGGKVAAVATTSPHLLDGAASPSMRLQRCRVAAGDLAGTALSGGEEGRYDRTRR